MTCDENDIGVGFGHASGDGTDASLSDQFDAYLGARIDLFEVVNKLGEIFDAINIVMGRGRDEGDARSGSAKRGDEWGYFVARKLTPFAWLGALGNLDFEFGGTGQIFGGDAEAGGGDLLDATIFGIAIFHGGKASSVFAPFARIGFSANAVHGDGKGFVSLGGEGAEGHACGGESAPNFFDGLDFLKGNRRATFFQAKKMANGDGSIFGEGIDVGGVLGGLVFLVGSFESDKGLESLDGGRGDGVNFPVSAPTIESRVGQSIGDGGGGGIAFGVAANSFGGEFGNGEAADLRRGTDQMITDEVDSKADGLEELAAVVTGEHADSHLGHNFEQAFV